MWGPPLLQKCYSQLSPKPVTFHEENLCDIRGVSSWSSWPSCFPWKVVRAMLFFVVFPGWQITLQTGQCPADWTLLYHGMKRCYTLLSWLGPGHQVLQSPGYTICKEFSSSSGVWYQCEGISFRNIPPLSSSRMSNEPYLPISNKLHKEKRNKPEFIQTSRLKKDHSLLPSWGLEFLSQLCMTTHRAPHWAVVVAVLG